MNITNTKNLLTTLAIVVVVLVAGCKKDDTSSKNSNQFSGKNMTKSTVPVVSASNFAVLAGSTITSTGLTVINGDIGVSPGTAVTGFLPSPLNTIVGPGTVTAGLGLVNGTIYVGDPVAAQAHTDAVTAYNYLVAQVPDSTFAGAFQLDGLTFTPGVYSFPSSANLQVNGTLYLDFQGNSNAQFIFQMGSTLVTMAGSNIIALNNSGSTCSDSSVFWAVGSSATINGSHFLGTVIADQSISMTSGGNVSGRIWALNGAVTMLTDTISTCGGSGGGPVPNPCRDFVTGGGWLKGYYDAQHHNSFKATFGFSGGKLNNKFWGQLTYKVQGNNGISVKSKKITSFTIINPTTFQIQGTAKINNQGNYTFTVVVVNNPGTNNDSFSLVLSNGYSVSGLFKGGSINFHHECGPHHGDKEDYHDDDEDDGNNDGGHNNHDNDHDD